MTEGKISYNTFNQTGSAPDTKRATNNMKTILLISAILVLTYSVLVTLFILYAPSREQVKEFFTFETPSNLDWRFI